MEFFTIGVYNATEQEFFDKLTQKNIDTFCDIRQRRGVRGAKYSFVNSNRLQQKLKDLEIRYEHIHNLAPTPEIRLLQKEADKENKTMKREREELGKVFITEYISRILAHFDFEHFINNLHVMGAKSIVLFCVEQQHEACHRSIVANQLAKNYKYNVSHL